jgi:transcriptional regulator with XRE-family HTH domain
MGINGKKVKELRINRNISQAKLALEIGTEQQVISKIELNKIPGVSFNTVCKIADWFGVSTDELK